jgi:thiosulfate reductase cytochrome b subunit
MLEDKKVPFQAFPIEEGNSATGESDIPESKSEASDHPSGQAGEKTAPVTVPKPSPPETESANNPVVVADGTLDSGDAEIESAPGKSAVPAEPEPVLQKSIRAVYEHPLPVRYCHWLNSIALVALALSGLKIFMAFPSFGPKIPQNNLIHKIPSWLMLGNWLGSALQWHFTFAWIYVATGVVYVGYQALSGNFRQMLFVPRDIPGVWPMVRHYFLFGPKPTPTEAYNPLQKIAYTSAILIGAFSFVTGMVLFNPMQFSFLAALMGGFHWARIWHFASLVMLGFFIFGHLMMVVLHGLNNFLSMFTGWKRDPEYVPTDIAVLRNQEDTKDA